MAVTVNQRRTDGTSYATGRVYRSAIGIGAGSCRAADVGESIAGANESEIGACLIGRETP